MNFLCLFHSLLGFEKEFEFASEVVQNVQLLLASSFILLIKTFHTYDVEQFLSLSLSHHLQ